MHHALKKKKLFPAKGKENFKANKLKKHITKFNLHCFELFGKHSSKEGSVIKSGEAGSMVCFLCLFLSESVVGGSKVNVALGTELMAEAHISFLQPLETSPATSNLGKKVVHGNLVGAEWLPLLHTTDVKLAFIEAISGLNQYVGLLEKIRTRQASNN